MKKLALTTAIAAAISFNTAIADDDDDKMMVYHVTVTNTTVHHKLTPPIIIAHKKGFHLFKVGDMTHPASPELAELAETGNPGPLAEMVKHNPKVKAVMTGNDLVHGGTPSTMYEIIAPKGVMFTVASMLASTNDAFTAATNIKAPKRNRHTHAMGMTYDAGSEKNNEDCDFIPGPPCGGAMNKNEAGEGYVTVHNGVFGKAGLPAAMYDWRGPTSMVSIHNAGKYRD